MPTATTTPSATLPTPELPPDQISDLLYLSRTGETTELHSTLTHLAKALGTTPSTLLASTIDPDTGNSLLHMASANGHTETIKSLLALCPSTPSSSSANSTILDRRNGSGNTPLHWAALNGHLDAVKELVGAGAGLDGRNEAGRKAVDEADEAGWVEVGEWLRIRGGSGGEGEEEEGEQVLSAGVEEGADGEKVEYGDSEGVGAEDGDVEQAMGDPGVGKS